METTLNKNPALFFSRLNKQPAFSLQFSKKNYMQGDTFELRFGSTGSTTVGYVYAQRTPKTLSAERERLNNLAAMANPNSLDILTSQAHLNHGQTVIDIGCGSGVLTNEIGQIVGPDGQATGIDIDGPMLELNRQELSPPPQVEFLQADILNDRISLDPADIVISRYLLAHLAQPLDAVRKMVGLCKPGGYVVLEDTAYDSAELASKDGSPVPSHLQNDFKLFTDTMGHGVSKPNIGRELPHLLEMAGLKSVDGTTYTHAAYDPKAPAKRSPLSSFISAKEGLIKEQQITAKDARRVEQSLETIVNNPNLTFERTVFQAWGQRSDK